MSRVRVLVAPDSFGEVLTAAEAAAAFADGWQGDASLCPLSDGGPGFIEVMSASLGGERQIVATFDPLLRPVTAEILRVGDTVYVESSQSCGLHLLAPDERDPLVASSRGVGRLLAASLDGEPSRVVVGLGGSATNDGGAGALLQLGAALEGVDETRGPQRGRLSSLRRLEGVEASWPSSVGLVGAVDVDNPLTGPRGASAVFARQKGASDDGVAVLEEALSRLASVATSDVPHASGLAELPGAGAAGGLGYALLLLGGRLESGAQLVLDAVHFDERLEGADLVVTGEGSLDSQSLGGKLVSEVARRARAAGVPCVAVAGVVALSTAELRRAGLTGAVSLSARAGSVESSLAEPARHLRSVAGAISSLLAEGGIAALAALTG